MSDGQDKSDDLIAELAKLMASSAGGSEPEVKAGPKLVSTPEPAAAAPRPAAPTIRIPGMDAPVVSGTPPTPAASTETVPPARPTIAPTIRIPGMDQPVAAPQSAVPSTPASNAPTPPAPASAAPAVAPVSADVKPAETRAPSINFGALPPAATIRPEPLSNWQDREIPKPVAARPTVTPEPTPAPPAAIAASPVATPPATPTVGPVETAAPKPETSAVVEAPSRQARDEAIVAGKPAPEGDGFDFDFGFGQNPPEPIAPGRSPETSTQPASASTGDPIADLIAADLDAATDDEPAPVAVPVRSPVQPPAVTRRVAPPAMPLASQQRPVATNPVKPPAVPAVASQQRPVGEPDRFATAPVFGVGSKPAAPAERDPMDEIESLIGEAVRVELSSADKPAAPERPRQSAAPVVPPLTTGFAPRRATIKDAEPHVASAEAAILAAAAAAGTDSGRFDSQIAAEPSASPYKRPKAKPEKKQALSGGMRQYVGMAVAGTLLLAAGFGLYWVLGMGRAPDTEAPVIQADTTPVKEPAPVTAPKGDAEGSVVFNQVGGANSTPPADEQIVSTDASVDTPVTDIAETVGAENGNGQDVAAVNTGESELANRKVRTVTVRPDGTIVTGDEAGGGGALPVDRPNVPDIPGADVEPSQLLSDVAANDAPVDTTTLAATDAAGTTAVADLGSSANIDPTIVAPIPEARPSDRSVLGGGSNQRVANTAPVDLTSGGNAAPVSTSGGSYVQLSSQPTQGDAQSSLRATQNRLSGVLNGRSLEIRQVDLGAKGTWYRVVLPTNSFSEATQTCASFKANGTDCVAING